MRSAFQLSILELIKLMGDVAKIQKEWTNTEIGVGYAAPFVHRQKGPDFSEPVKIIDMTKKHESGAKEGRYDDEGGQEKKHRKHEKETRSSSSSSGERESGQNTEDDNFNPFLQELATRLSNKTRVFAFANE